MDINLGIRANAAWEGDPSDMKMVVRTYLTNVGGSFDVQISHEVRGRYECTLEEAERYAVDHAVKALALMVAEHMTEAS